MFVEPSMAYQEPADLYSLFSKNITRIKMPQIDLAGDAVFRLLVETIDDVFWVRDVSLEIMHYISPAYERIWGRTAESLYENPRSLIESIHPNDTARVFFNLGADKIGQPFDHEYRVVRPDGTIRWVWDRGFPISDKTGKVTHYTGVVKDVTERKQIEAERRIADAAFNVQEGMMLTNADSVILRVNNAFTEVTGYTAVEAVGQTPRLLKSGNHDEAFYAAMWKSINNTGAWNGEIWNRRKNGEIYPAHITINAVKDSTGNVTNYMTALKDITASKAAAEEIQNLAFHDPLTNLPNRRLLLDRFSQALSVSARNNYYGAILFIDMDEFKLINDTLGHDQGDLLLIEATQRIQACVREVDTVARMGGDEFLVLIENIDTRVEDTLQRTAAIAEKLRAALAAPYRLMDHEHYSTPSIGVNLYRGHEESVETLLKRADIAMYQSKDCGGNAIRFFDFSMQLAVEAHAALESDLREALPNQQLRLHYQIQMDNGHHPIGAEALVRWTHPRRGSVSPADFIPVAEKSSLILEIGHWVLDTACQQIAAWSHNEATRNLVLAVNISAQQFKQADFVEQIVALIQKYRIDPSRLKLELTESIVVDDMDFVAAKMLALRHVVGVTLSLDDFGTGFSSLSILKRLPLHQIKIDQSFVRNMSTDASDAVMVKTIIAMAHNFGLHVIAEGVEIEAQLALLKEHGCMAYQGYLFSKPVQIEQFEDLLKQGYAPAKDG